ncbi:MAG: SAM-dependent methyltransferase, partial [Bacteroidota bacterium]
KQARLGGKNIEGILGTEQDPKLPKGQVDAVLMVDVYHEFAYPFEMMMAIHKSLSPDGKVYLVEYRGEDPKVPIKPRHKMTAEQAIREMEAAGLAFVKNLTVLPRQHLLVFELKK